MGVYLKEFDNETRQFLKSILEHSLDKEFDPKISLNIIEAIEKKYVTGIETRMIETTGLYVFDFKNPNVTRKGLEFLELKSPHFRANLAIGISLIALLIPLLAYMRQIYENIHWFISILYNS